MSGLLEQAKAVLEKWRTLHEDQKFEVADEHKKSVSGTMKDLADHMLVIKQLAADVSVEMKKLAEAIDEQEKLEGGCCPETPPVDVETTPAE